jgi:hypothetical protein
VSILELLVNQTLLVAPRVPVIVARVTFLEVADVLANRLLLFGNLRHLGFLVEPEHFSNTFRAHNQESGSPVRQPSVSSSCGSSNRLRTPQALLESHHCVPVGFVSICVEHWSCRHALTFRDPFGASDSALLTS